MFRFEQILFESEHYDQIKYLQIVFLKPFQMGAKKIVCPGRVSILKRHLFDMSILPKNIQM